MNGTHRWLGHNPPETSRGITSWSMEQTKPRTLQNVTWNQTTRKDLSHTHSSISSAVSSKQTVTWQTYRSS